MIHCYRGIGGGRRLKVLGCRVHHGIVGFALVIVGLAVVVHDRRDFPWLRDAW